MSVSDGDPLATDSHSGQRVTGWFDARVRPLVRYPTGDGATWVALDDVVAEPALEQIEDRQLREAGAAQKVALTTVAGWTAGYVAAAIAVGVLRDGVLVRLSAARHAEALRDSGGWLADVRFADAPLAVAADHPLSGGAGVEVVDDPASGFGAEITAVLSPWIDVLATRSGRSRNGLWAMVADAVGSTTATLASAEPSRSLAGWAESVDALLAREGAPWRRRPSLRVVDDPTGPVLVSHRSSCCLWYRCDPDLADDPIAARADIDEEPNYCSTCLFRDASDVEARARSAAREQA